jgi:hypothetical protein
LGQCSLCVFARTAPQQDNLVFPLTRTPGFARDVWLFGYPAETFGVSLFLFLALFSPFFFTYGLCVFFLVSFCTSIWLLVIGIGIGGLELGRGKGIGIS